MTEVTLTDMVQGLGAAMLLLDKLPPDLPTPTVFHFGSRCQVEITWLLSLPVVSNDQRGDLRRIMKAVGGTWDKSLTDGDAFRLRQVRDGIVLGINCDRPVVCTRRVVGTREVERVIPAQPAIEEHTVTETVEDVEWDCEPILAERIEASA